MKVISAYTPESPDVQWWHVDGGLNLSKASLGLFLYTCLKLGIYTTNYWALNEKYDRSSVFVPIRCTEEQKAELLKAMPKLKLITPPQVH